MQIVPAPVFDALGWSEQLPPHRRPFTGMETDDGLQTGDRCVALVELRKGDAARQWLIDFQCPTPVAAPATASEAEAERRARIFTSTGREFVFSARHIALAVRVFGPVKLNETSAEPMYPARLLRKTAILPVSAEFLRLGFAGYAAVWTRIRAGVAVDGAGE